MYIINSRNQTEEFDSREQAIQSARELSMNGNQRVQVEDEKGRESMVYFRGDLQTYRYQSH